MIYTSFCPTPFHLVQLTLRSLVDSSAVFHLPPAIQHLIKMNQFENKNKRTFHINKTYQLISISLMWKSEEESPMWIFYHHTNMGGNNVH
jgi:hypothetical protein